MTLFGITFIDGKLIQSLLEIFRFIILVNNLKVLQITSLVSKNGHLSLKNGIILSLGPPSGRIFHPLSPGFSQQDNCLTCHKLNKN